LQICGVAQELKSCHAIGVAPNNVDWTARR